MVYPSDINLNLNTRYVLPIPTAQQGDTARVLTFNILDKGVPFSLQGKTVRAKILKPDNTKCYNDLTITNATNGECTLNLTNQILAVAGKVNCQLEIKEGEELLSTIIFSIDVEPSIDITGAVESSNEFTALQNGLTKLDEWDKYFQETSGAIEEKYTTRLNAVESSLKKTTNELGNKLNKDRVVAENKKDSTLPLMELFSYAGQEDLSKIIALILHHYADGDVVQLDNVGEGNCILRLKNAYNPLHRPDKGESFIGTGNFLELCFHNLDTGKQVILGRIDKDGNFTWSEFAKTITFRHNKADDGTAPFQISIGTKHSTLFRFLNANSTVLEILNDGANGLKAHFRSGSGQTDGMQFEARQGNLDLVALNGYVTINGDANNKVLSTGTTSRPTNPFEGQIWYNRGSKKYEFWNGSAWNVF